MERQKSGYRESWNSITVILVLLRALSKGPTFNVPIRRMKLGKACLA